MITDAQATLLHAAELLEAEAKALNEFWNNKKNPPEWIGAPKARAIHDDALCTALELRLLARSIHDGKVAVPPAPTFADGMTAEDDRRFLELTNDLTHNAELRGRTLADGPVERSGTNLSAGLGGADIGDSK